MQVTLDAHAIDEPAVLDELADALAAHQLDGSAIVLEFGALSLAATSDNVLTKFHRLAVQFCVDDIGAAISAAMGSHGGLVRAVRLASAWTEALSTEFDDRRILRAVLATADAMRLTTIASGVRTREQRELLIDAGCRLGIGDYLGKPADLSQMLRSLDRRELDAATP
jgi:EAL domain-containing protein (putative c-di-GMP-specific phosphodiesterase class I)